MTTARTTHRRVSLAWLAMIAASSFAISAGAADYKVTNDAPTVVYDAPSAKARALFLFGRDVPVEVIVEVEGWTKVRDVGGTIGWIATPSLADRRELIVRTPVAEIRAAPEDAAPIVFRAEQNVLLELAETATSTAGTSVPGWVKVRHRDGQVGYVRIAQVFGL
ncbi:MAG: SH3 domain-containing protein [Casimicrobiaceae bacterium]